MVLRTYRVREVTGDRYACEWPRERSRAHGIDYLVSETTKIRSVQGRAATAEQPAEWSCSTYRASPTSSVDWSGERRAADDGTASTTPGATKIWLMQRLARCC